MDPVLSLFAALLALHVVEGVFWVRRVAVAFRRTWGRHGRADTTGPLGNRTHTLLALSPLPPMFELFVVEPWPITFGRDGVWPLAPEVHEGGGNDATPTPVEAALRAKHEGKELRARGHLAEVSSPALAHQLAALLRAWAEVKPARRGAHVRAAVEARFDRQAVRARIDEFRQATRLLGILANLTPLALFGGLYGFFFVPAATQRWPALLGLIGGLLVLTWIETFRAHTRLYPELGGDRAMKLFLLVLSFPAAARARAWLARDVLAGFHPLAVGEALLPRDDFAALAGELWRRLRFPLEPEPAAAKADLAAARAELLEAFGTLLRAAGLEPSTLEAPPAKVTATARSFCPRCRAEYLELDGACPDCPGVARRPFPPA